MHSLVAELAASCRSCSWLPGRLRSDRSRPSLSRTFPTYNNFDHRGVFSFTIATCSKTSNCQISTITYLFNVSWIVVSVSKNTKMAGPLILCQDYNICFILACRTISTTNCTCDIGRYCTTFCYSLERSHNILLLSTSNKQYLNNEP